MKKKNLKSLKLVKENISRLEFKKNDQLKGGTAGNGTDTYCNTRIVCWLH